MNLFSNTKRKAPDNMPDLDLYVTVKEAAAKLDFTVQGVGKLIRQKKLEAVMVGRMYLVSKESIAQYKKATQGVSKRNPHRGKNPKK